MARDYKTKRNKPNKFAGWIGLGCGLGLGLAVALVVYLKDHRLDAPMASVDKVIKKKSRGNEPPQPWKQVRKVAPSYRQRTERVAQIPWNFLPDSRRRHRNDGTGI